MKSLSYLLAGLGVILFVYAIVGRFVGDPAVFSYFFPLEAKTVVIGANTLLLIAILAHLYSKK